ncbi:MAG TPA: hypothetical protein VHO03_17305 [Ignavibacteriales bacterium]|nr:hypothetical protein [Ignavibacteriales bacterium]
MKRGIFSLAFILVIIAFGSLQAQIKQNTSVKVLPDGHKVIYFSGATAGTQTYNSNSFSIPEALNESLTTYPVVFGAQLTGTSTATRKITCYIQGTNFDGGTYANVDTLLYADSSNVEIQKTANLNGKKYVYYRLSVVGATGNTNTIWKLCIYPYKKD